MRIGIDLDGVCVDFGASWVRQYGVWFARDVDRSKMSVWNNIVEATHFDSEPEFWAWVDEVPRFWFHMDPIPGAAGAIMRLRQAGHDVIFVTNRKGERGTSRRDTEHWIEEHLGPVGELHMVRNKADVDWRVLVDDSPKNLAKLADDPRPVIRFKQPWNGGAPGIAADGWAEVLAILNAMSEVVA